MVVTVTREELQCSAGPWYGRVLDTGRFMQLRVVVVNDVLLIWISTKLG